MKLEEKKLLQKETHQRWFGRPLPFLLAWRCRPTVPSLVAGLQDCFNVIAHGLDLGVAGNSQPFRRMRRKEYFLKKRYDMCTRKKRRERNIKITMNKIMTCVHGYEERKGVYQDTNK